MANEFLSQLGRQAPHIALAFLAARKGGPMALAALEGGMAEAQQRQEAMSRQAQLDEERRAAQVAQEARLANADTRAQEQVDRQRVKDLMDALSTYDADPTALANLYKVPQEQVAPLMPAVTSRRDKQRAREIVERAKKDPQWAGWFESEESMAQLDAQTLPWKESTIKFGELRAMAEEPQIPPKLAAPKKDTPNTPEEQDIADAIAVEEERLGRKMTPAERRKVRLGSMTDVSGARRKPEDEELAGIRRETAELRRDMLRNTQQTDPKKVATFNQIAGSYERSPLIRAGDRTLVLTDAIKAIEKSPSDPASQLALAYSYIQALDTYQSAVREGELGNLGILGTRWQGFLVALNRVASEGAFMPPEVAKNIAANAKQLVTTIETGRQRKQQEFSARARVSGVGDMWDQFVGGFDAPAPNDPAASARDKLNRR